MLGKISEKKCAVCILIVGILLSLFLSYNLGMEYSTKTVYIPASFDYGLDYEIPEEYQPTQLLDPKQVDNTPFAIAVGVISFLAGTLFSTAIAELYYYKLKFYKNASETYIKT